MDCNSFCIYPLIAFPLSFKISFQKAVSKCVTDSMVENKLTTLWQKNKQTKRKTTVNIKHNKTAD